MQGKGRWQRRRRDGRDGSLYEKEEREEEKKNSRCDGCGSIGGIVESLEMSERNVFFYRRRNIAGRCLGANRRQDVVSRRATRKLSVCERRGEAIKWFEQSERWMEGWMWCVVT